MNQLILIVDDNPTNLKLAGDLLEIEGLNVQRVEDAEKALYLVYKFHPDLILMDVALPGMDGLTLTRILKADPATMNIIIVALTAFAMNGDKEKATSAGCDGYITKPINSRKFSGEVIEFLKNTIRNENFDC
ncbi:response regulator receiver protein [Chitinophaga sp. CF118]|uniref:response regulator n=1 Tax=Chitinophaga sp. CF118 TaxID=1884367 RepID=UPI0008E40202|nr:response regulator [Chitinophaga sp. CF118]SFD82527.1 response regulator receiver protein [Chitinophaga sp. CF118]